VQDVDLRPFGPLTLPGSAGITADIRSRGFIDRNVFVRFEIAASAPDPEETAAPPKITPLVSLPFWQQKSAF